MYLVLYIHLCVLSFKKQFGIFKSYCPCFSIDNYVMYPLVKTQLSDLKGQGHRYIKMRLDIFNLQLLVVDFSVYLEDN